MLSFEGVERKDVSQVECCKKEEQKCSAALEPAESDSGMGGGGEGSPGQRAPHPPL